MTESRRALITADAFKGTLSSAEVGEALAAGLADAGMEATVLAAGDGGEGTGEALLASLGGEQVPAEVSGPLGEGVDAHWVHLSDGRGVVEVAAASGLGLVEESRRDAWAADTFGTGELIVAAARAGCTRVLVAAGGSATTDGGAGAVRALDEAGIEIEIDVICDVRTSWERAAAMFAPQKGADRATVERLKARLADLADAAPRDPRGVAMTGCAGGLSGGLWAHRGARLRPGAAFILDAIGFDRALPSHQAVLTGEGRLDDSTLEGKLVGEVARRAGHFGAGCHAVVGGCGLRAEQTRAMGLSSVCVAGGPGDIRAAAAALALSGFDPGADG